MISYKIKILKETYVHSEGSIIDMDEFRKHYPTAVHKDNSDTFLVKYSQGEIKDDFNSNLSKFFEVIREDIRVFQIGDWVWHEVREQAYLVVYNTDVNSKLYRPNHISIYSANYCTDFYKRLATPEEIKNFTLHEFCNSRLLISKFKCYFCAENQWVEVCFIHYNIRLYLKGFGKVNYVYKGGISEPGFKVRPMGITVSCIALSDPDVRNIAELLDIYNDEEL